MQSLHTPSQWSVVFEFEQRDGTESERRRWQLCSRISRASASFVPGRTPSSTSDSFIRSPSVASEMPMSLTIRDTGALQRLTTRTTSSRNPREYLVATVAFLSQKSSLDVRCQPIQRQSPVTCLNH
jgi:hypothetical protein